MSPEILKAINSDPLRDISLFIKYLRPVPLRSLKIYRLQSVALSINISLFFFIAAIRL
ncbi:hypothetical protein C2G38_2068441 [Gigaspora rosea]|uniref:Uncharacterized protein n=1 Tax=Gigaspora rosea TaxID=44941 RepID=A0A397VR82_9GLOM|nr:hypothetical protein C2G38_2068441 [Gigaspora rosea]